MFSSHSYSFPVLFKGTAAVWTARATMRVPYTQKSTLLSLYLFSLVRCLLLITYFSLTTMISSRFLPSLCSLAAALSSATDSITILTPISAPILFLIVAV